MKNFLFYFLSKFNRLFSQVTISTMILLVVNSTIIVQWLPNIEPDLAGYKIYCGMASRSYNRIIDVQLVTSYSIHDLQAGFQYFFAVSAYDTAGNESPLSDEMSIYLSDNNHNPVLSGQENAYNFPNPFNPEKQYTQIRYFINEPENLTIVIFDVTGNKVRTLLKNSLKSPGEHIEDVWDGRNEHGSYVSNGIYYAQLKSESLDQYVAIAVTR